MFMTLLNPYFFFHMLKFIEFLALWMRLLIPKPVASASDFLTLAMGQMESSCINEWALTRARHTREFFNLQCMPFSAFSFTLVIYRELPDVQAEFRKGRGTRDQIANIWKQENFRKTSTCASLTTLKPLTVQITTNCGKFFKSWKYQLTLPASWETCMQVKKQQLELDMEQQSGSKLGKEHDKAVYCHLTYLTFMQSTSCKMPDCIMHKLQSRWQGEILITSHMQMTPPLWQKVKRN